ncbi:hypothetical protein ACIQWS_25250, partial [Phyllobacterium sp. NPDC097923]|uniref:hypothetical protein n=1 Tax=Phyllobacterium sp. NPDC097923 TaxID=3364404 RepID=UPI003839D5E5
TPFPKKRTKQNFLKSAKQPLGITQPTPHQEANENGQCNRTARQKPICHENRESVRQASV